MKNVNRIFGEKIVFIEAVFAEVMSVFYHEFHLSHLEEFDGMAVAQVNVLVLSGLVDRAQCTAWSVFTVKFTDEALVIHGSIIVRREENLYLKSY